MENKNENKTIKIESPIKIEKHNEYNYEKLKKMNGYKKKIFNLNDSLEKNKENSTLLNDNTKLLNTINTEEKFDNKNIENVNEYKTKKVKPYYRKVIKNTINNDTNNNCINTKNLKQDLSSKTSSVSHLSTNNDYYQKRRQFNSIAVNPIPYNRKVKEEKLLDDDLNSIKLENNLEPASGSSA